MHKVFLKPTFQELVVKSNSKENRTDVFSYDYYDDDNKRKLGGLFVVGNVKQDHNDKNEKVGPPDLLPDMAYVTNLVASLAKREYYSSPDLSPREAFAATLKKINNVVEEFFKNKSLKINIGIFTIAGEQILISKLGKFKILLGRDSKIIDILNNIDLFNKELVEEKEFSNIVSGKVVPGDRLFAFYPDRSITTREKNIKADLLKLNSTDFIEKINSIQKIRPDFNCGALYISLNNHKIPAIIKKTQPISLVEKNILPVNLVKSDSNNASPNNEGRNDPLSFKTPQEKIETIPEVPRIISSEFSLGKKNNPLLAPIRILKNLYTVSGSYTRNVNLKRKFIILFLITGMLAIGGIVVKKFVVINPEQRQLNTVISQTQNNLKLARTKIEQNDLIGARRLLAESLSNIYTTSIKDDRTQKTTIEIYNILDNIDKVTDAEPSLLETMPVELSQQISALDTQAADGIAFNIYENNLYILKPDGIFKKFDINQNSTKETVPWLKPGTVLPPEPLMLAVDGNIYVINGSGTLATYYKGEKISEINTFIVSNSGDVLLTSKDSDKLYIVNKTLARIYELDKESKSLIRTIKIGSFEPFVDAYLYDNGTIIVATKDGKIWKIKLSLICLRCGQGASPGSTFRVSQDATVVNKNALGQAKNLPLFHTKKNSS